ncbi:MAG: hypothetical protein R3F41_12245 [Gammaproteobacteria bacterium]|nr:hypothetical protein [Pseudomonadales bacterium]
MKMLRPPAIFLCYLFLVSCGDSGQSGSTAALDSGSGSGSTAGVPADGVVGSWRDDVSNPIFFSTLTIVAENGKYFLDTEYDDGSSRRTPLVESSSPLGRRFDIDPGVNTFQMRDYWVIDADGNLMLQNELNSGTGPIARKIE